MSTDGATAIGIAEAKDQRDGLDRRSTELWARFHRALFERTELIEEIPDGATLVLVPTDDRELAERELELGLAALRDGRDVYFRHVRLADLPDVPDEPNDPPVGQRRTFFNRDGAIARQEVCGPDGAWHAVEPPEPVDE